MCCLEGPPSDKPWGLSLSWPVPIVGRLQTDDGFKILGAPRCKSLHTLLVRS